MKSFLNRLNIINFDNLSPKERYLIDYIKDNYESLVGKEVKIQWLAKQAGVGYSSIYHILNEFGYTGFKEFADSLVYDTNDNDSQIMDESCIESGYIDIIQKNYNLINKNDIYKSMDIIFKAQRVFVCYWENNLKGPAQELTNLFYNSKINSYLLDDDQDTLKERIETMQYGDVFIFLTKYGLSTRLENLIKLISIGKAKIIYISGRMPKEHVKNRVHSFHTLVIDTNQKGTDNKIHIPISKSVPFHYWNDLFIYHFLKGINANIREEINYEIIKN